MICATDFDCFQIFFLKTPLIAHVSPYAALIVHMDNAALFFGKWRAIADDFLRLDVTQYLVVYTGFRVMEVILFRATKLKSLQLRKENGESFLWHRRMSRQREPKRKKKTRQTSCLLFGPSVIKGSEEIQ